MGMLRLAPEIQEYILSMPDTVHRPAISERALRPIAQLVEGESVDQLISRTDMAPYKAKTSGRNQVRVG